MTIQDLMDQFKIEGPYCIKRWSDKRQHYIVISKGDDFEYILCRKNGKIKHYLDWEIQYMYAQEEALHIEIKRRSEE